MKRGILFAVMAALVATTASAQINSGGPVVYGHHHLTASDVDASKRFWADTLGGHFENAHDDTWRVKFPNVSVYFARGGKPTAGSAGSTADHIAFSVPDIRAMVDRLEANGYKIITATAAPTTFKVANGVARENDDVSVAFVLGPDDAKVELVQDRSRPVEKTTLHHIHLFGPDREAMRAWYVKAFGAVPRAGAGAFVAADLPGVALYFTQVQQPVAPTEGRAVDHIGFEIQGLEALSRRLIDSGVKFDLPYTYVKSLGFAAALLKDPWGTRIELNEGLREFERPR